MATIQTEYNAIKKEYEEKQHDYTRQAMEDHAKFLREEDVRAYDTAH